MFRDFRFEQVRLASFKDWPYSSTTSPQILATKGFFYLQYGDEVKCFSCYTQFAGWENIETLLTLHELHCEHCMSQTGDTRNIPLGSDPLLYDLGYDTIDFANFDI